MPDQSFGVKSVCFSNAVGKQLTNARITHYIESGYYGEHVKRDHERYKRLADALPKRSRSRAPTVTIDGPLDVSDLI